MHPDTITFQLATHFLPKIALRLECLYQTVVQACDEVHPIIHHYALQNIIELLKLIEKPELKSRFLKEFMRIEHTLNKSNTIIKPALYNELYTQIQTLTHVVGRFGENIHNNPFIQSIRLTQPLHGSDSEAHTPQLLFWLESEPTLRQRDLSTWLANLRTLHSTVNFYLSLLRDTAHFDKIDMNNGFYQCQIPPRHTCHLILLSMDKSLGMIPKIQLGHHGLSLRLYEVSTMREVRDTEAQIDLALCQL